jgi:hypothetical protein
MLVAINMIRNLQIKLIIIKDIVYFIFSMVFALQSKK